MVKSIIAQEHIEVPEDIELKLMNKEVWVMGPQGELRRNFAHAPVSLRRDEARLIVEAPWPDKKAEATVGTVRSHIQNMITGVTRGFTVKLKIVFAHFPMTVKVQGARVIIENFGGERRPRTARIYGDVKITIEEEDIIVQGLDIEHVTQTAANIQQATRVKKKDPRIFLDGIYVYEREEGM